MKSLVVAFAYAYAIIWVYDKIVNPAGCLKLEDGTLLCPVRGF